MHRSLFLLAATVRSTQRRHPIDVPRLQRSADAILDGLGMKDYALDVWITSDRTVRTMNDQYRGQDKPTDVLSFPFQKLQPHTVSVPVAASSSSDASGFFSSGATPHTIPHSLPPAVRGALDLGEIVISAKYVAKQLQSSQLTEKTLDDRLQTLLVHGVCHLLGYDHEQPDESAQMEAMEQRILSMLKSTQTESTR